jgi:hypothetical protein
VSTIAITTPPADSSDTTRAGRMRHLLAADIIKAMAEKHGAYVCAFTMEVGDRDTGTVLSNSGLVTFSPYTGASVCVVDAQLAKSVYDIRLVLESEAVRRTVEHRETLLDDAAKALKESSVAITNRDQAALSLLNRQFHRALYSGCGNPHLVNVLHDLKDRAG